MMDVQRDAQNQSDLARDLEAVIADPRRDRLAAIREALESIRETDKGRVIVTTYPACNSEA